MERESLTMQAKQRRESVQKHYLREKYGLTPHQYEQLCRKQKGCCAICGRHQLELNRSLSVDHNHVTGEIRGLLCGNCNSALGLFKDSRRTLFKAMQYLGRKK